MEPTTAPVWLEPSADRARHNDALAEAAGGRAGLEGVLDELGRSGRTARRSRLLGRPATVAWAWELRDDLSRRWWPQGVTTSADAGAVAPGTGDRAPQELYAGRRVVVTSAYSKVVDGVGHGARISVVDVTDPGRVRYEHVLLVEAVAGGADAAADAGTDAGTGAGAGAGVEVGADLRVEPVRSHAGGLVWHGDHLHVAATRGGFHSFRLSDIVPARGLDRPAVLGPLEGGGVGAHGHRWLLPTRLVHAARTAEGGRPFRWSWLSSAGEDGRVVILGGEYAPPARDRADGNPTRLAEVTVDPATGLPALDADGLAHPRLLGEVVRQAQGAVRVGDEVYVGSSNGRFRRGSVWVAPWSPGGLRPGSFTRRPGTLPVGPEDLAHWPSRDELWTVTEYPGRRRLVVLDRAPLGREPGGSRRSRNGMSPYVAVRRERPDPLHGGAVAVDLGEARCAVATVRPVRTGSTATVAGPGTTADR